MTEHSSPKDSDIPPKQATPQETDAPLMKGSTIPTPTSRSSSSQSPDPQLFAYSYKSVSGPLPSPDVLRDFDRVLPGLAQEIVDRSKQEMQHRHTLEATALQAKVDDQTEARKQLRRGQWMAFALAIGFLTGGVVLTLNGYPGVGGVIATTTVVSLVAIFVTGRLASNPQEAAKFDEIEQEN